ncbi:sugar phosphate isomerase/epimerase [Acidaminobacter sp. JC074]|uniref:sugar phosphate isomerase/epimerase family protein n=1 Tax=Acidaminobacter sp. JC074 TaxID=2530199 RepID=UPI001F117BC0|nr:sugar phosphate isomerase/epimerase family protein [Acidaminobacter sp. JC074]MCH4887016.1 sugar phosphate isomerase/epimerase [Acidaminobacter sp. JC074]
MNNFVLSGFSDEISSDFTVQLSEMKKMNIAYIEVRGVNGKNISELTKSEVIKVKRQLKDFGIKVSAIGSPIGKIKMTDDFEAHFEMFKHIVWIAETLETPFIRMFSFYMNQDETSKYRDQVIERLSSFKDYIKDKKIVLLHENEKEIYGDTPERCLDLYKTLGDDQFKLIFDPANFIQCGVNVKEAYDLLNKYVSYFHIKDATKDGKEVPAGMGVGNLKYLIESLKEKGYDGFLSVEPHLGNFQGFDKLETSSVDKEASDVYKFKLAVNALRTIIEEVCHD